MSWRGVDCKLPQVAMETPRVDGMKLGGRIGHGGCGQVYPVLHDGNEPHVVKLFDEKSISWKLLEKMTLRLEMGGWPAGVMHVKAANFHAKQIFWITPMIVDSKNENSKPRTLQMQLDHHPGTYTWTLVKSLARALARMHERRVAHGNLKPGNVFLSEDGEVILSDWTLGNMPGIAQFQFTDAVLYQAPEQLRNPWGYVDEAGYRWDSYAFGVMAYRLLTGKFPRCHDTFQMVAPASGDACKEGIQADLFRIARNLELQPDFRWPDEAQNSLEAGFRNCIDRCLSLDPMLRPSTMFEVVAEFAALETKAASDDEREALMDQRRRSERSDWRTLLFAGATTGAALLMGGMWYFSNTQLTLEKTVRAQDGVRAVKGAEKIREDIARESEITAAEIIARDEAAEKQAQVKQSLEYERELGVARLEASRLIGDRLFSWAMEKGNRRLPPLDGRELRLKRLERYFEDFLTRTSDVATLADEHNRVRLQLAEISLAAGDSEAANRRLRDAIEAVASAPMDGEMKLRMATNSLLLALLQQSNADPEASTSFVAARRALTAVPQTEVDADRLQQLMAVLDFHEAKLLAGRGEDSRALEQLMRATKSLNRIADARPDAAILRSELAACYLSSATILEGMGSLGDAREVRSLASVELVKMLKVQPTDFPLRLDLAGCYAAMAESAVLSGDIAGAETMSREAMKLLDQLVVEQPDHAEAVSRKASQLGLRAGIQRDRGLATQAMADYDEGIRMMEAASVSAPGNSMLSYRLGLLWWQKGRMLGMTGDREGEILLISKAKDLLGNLEADPNASGPRPEQLQSSGAYLLGDLGHALQLSGRKPEATRAFSDAVDLWERLAKSRPKSEEYLEGLEWCRQRLNDLQ